MRLYDNADLLVWRDEEAGAPVIRFEGEVSSERADEELAPLVNGLHAEAIANAVTELRIDLSGLRFLNSRGIKCLVNWIMNLKALAPAQRYALCFLYSPTITWQRNTLSALTHLNGQDVEISILPV